MNSQLNTIMADAIDENRAEKLCLIDDIIRVKKLLFARGETQHNEFIRANTAGELFNALYDTSIKDLTTMRNKYCDQITQIFKKQIL
jgi:hypothetical protein